MAMGLHEQQQGAVHTSALLLQRPFLPTHVPPALPAAAALPARLMAMMPTLRLRLFSRPMAPPVATSPESLPPPGTRGSGSARPYRVADEDDAASRWARKCISAASVTPPSPPQQQLSRIAAVEDGAKKAVTSNEAKKAVKALAPKN